MRELLDQVKGFQRKATIPDPGPRKRVQYRDTVVDYVQHLSRNYRSACRSSQQDVPVSVQVT